MATCGTIYAVPGQRGRSGTNGVNGVDGKNAYTITTSNFEVPAEGDTVVIEVEESDWAVIGQIVFIEFAGYYEVTAKPSSTELTVKNLEDTAASEYTGNAAPLSDIPSQAGVGPAGLQGPSGNPEGSLDGWFMVQTMTDLRALATVATNKTAILAGDASFLDGGGGIYVWDASSVLADDGVSVIEPDDSTGQGRWRKLL